MNIADIFKKKTVFSFEVFPPKKESGVETIYKTLEELKDLNPDFISVTYGAGGVGVANATTIDLCSMIKNKYGVETIAHLSCLYNTKESIDEILNQLKENGIFHGFLRVWQYKMLLFYPRAIQKLKFRIHSPNTAQRFVFTIQIHMLGILPIVTQEKLYG